MSTKVPKDKVLQKESDRLSKRLLKAVFFVDASPDIHCGTLAEAIREAKRFLDDISGKTDFDVSELQRDLNTALTAQRKVLEDHPEFKEVSGPVIPPKVLLFERKFIRGRRRQYRRK